VVDQKNWSSEFLWDIDRSAFENQLSIMSWRDASYRRFASMVYDVSFWPSSCCSNPFDSSGRTFQTHTPTVDVVCQNSGYPKHNSLDVKFDLSIFLVRPPTLFSPVFLFRYRFFLKVWLIRLQGFLTSFPPCRIRHRLFTLVKIEVVRRF
jgi:hypothetical protein